MLLYENVEKIEKSFRKKAVLRIQTIFLTLRLTAIKFVTVFLTAVKFSAEKISEYRIIRKTPGKCAFHGKNG